MADLTLASFQARFPEFSTAGITDARQQIAVDDANAHLLESTWGTCYQKAAAYYAAHMLLFEQSVSNAVSDDGLEGGAGTEGALTFASAGPLSASFGASIEGKTLNDDFYTQSAYGKVFLNLRAECLSGRRLAGCV